MVSVSSNETLSAAIADSSQGFALFDAQDRLSFANASFLKMYDISEGQTLTWESMMRNCHQQKKGLMIATDDIDTWLKNVQSKRRRTPVRAFESDLVDGRWLWVVETVRPDGWMFVIATDITALKRNEDALRLARDSAVLEANTDALTGLFNRRFMLNRLDNDIEQVKSGGESFSISLLDLDHFKQINDTYGHRVGDQVLQHFANQAQCHLRPVDMIGRIGGEEFLIIFPATRLAGASRAMSRLRRIFRKSCPIPEIPGFKYTFSAGVTEVWAGDTQESLLERADAALYSAKQMGRNRHVSRSYSS